MAALCNIATNNLKFSCYGMCFRLRNNASKKCTCYVKIYMLCNTATLRNIASNNPKFKCHVPCLILRNIAPKPKI